jgi:ABC-type cobalamin/Fe3+-siderophores transport system ATPase subunit
MTNSIEVKDLTLNFGAVSVLKNMNLDVAEGEFVVLLGPSGCGKSTLLNCLAGLLDITDGQIFIKGKNEIVIDEHIPQYMSTLKQTPQQVEAIMSLSDIGSGFSDNFSFIENGQQQPKNFVSVAPVAPLAASTSASASGSSGGKSSKFDSSEYERFTQQRDLDAASFMNKPR